MTDNIGTPGSTNAYGTHILTQDELTAQNGGVANLPQGGGSGTFLKALQDKLLSQSSLISSDNSNIDTAIQGAMAGVQKSGDLTHQATTLNYNSQEQTAAQKGANTLTSFEEASRGYAVNTGLVKNIQDTTTKQINDLDLKKQEALASGDAATASSIAQLQLQGLQFQQQATQQAFTNLLSVGNFMIQGAAAARADQTQTDQEKSAISNIALQYGLTVQPGDTIDTITSRAQPFASAKQKMDLAQQQAAINASNATAAKAISDANAGANLSAADIDSLAKAYISTPAVMSLVKNATVAAQIIQKSADYQYVDYKNTATVNKQNGVSKAAAQAAVNTDTSMSATDKLAKLKAIEEIYGVVAPPAPFSLSNSIKSLQASITAPFIPNKK